MSRYFQQSEFKCKCGRAECPAPAASEVFLMRLDGIRKMCDIALYITSGVRCPWYNEKVGGEKNSEHELGLGADIDCRSGALRYKLVRAAIMLNFTRIGIGENFVHVGISKQHPDEVIWHYYKKGEGH